MLKRFLISLFLVIITITLLAQPAAAIVYQEDPNAVEQIFSGLALLQYYSASLDPVLQKDPAGTEAGLDKMPFANIPAALGKPTADFAGSGIALSSSIAGLYNLWQQENTLVGQYRLQEAAQLADRITGALPQARVQLAQLQISAQSTGAYLKIASLAPGSSMASAYTQVMDKIKQLGDMLDLFSRPLIDIGKIKEILSSTNLAMDINPQTAFVGDEVDFAGTLSSQGIALQDRQVELLLDSLLFTAVTTDAQGRFQGQLLIPYRYVPQMEVQAIYYPDGQDIGVYLGSSSPVIKLTTRFYQAKLEIQAGPAYPDREAAVSGKLDYGLDPPLEQRAMELYLDDDMLAQFPAGTDFTQKIHLSPDLILGRHTLTVSAPASGRYAPVNAAYLMDVTRAAAVLEMNTPRIGLIPGNLDLAGKVSSAVGPLQGAAVNLQVNGTKVQAVSSAGGAFNARLRMGPQLSLIGSQSISIQVQPQEPWNAPLAVTRKLFMVNLLNCGLLLLVLVLLAFYLPRRFKKWFRNYGGNAPAPVEVGGAPPQRPESRPAAGYLTGAAESPSEKIESPDSIFNWYRLVLRLVQKMTGAVLKPQQTLREYARENGRALGPLGRYFIEFTLLMERLIYSRHKATDADIARSKQLSRSIEGEAKSENL